MAPPPMSTCWSSCGRAFMREVVDAPHRLDRKLVHAARRQPEGDRKPGAQIAFPVATGDAVDRQQSFEEVFAATAFRARCFHGRCVPSGLRPNGSGIASLKTANQAVT